MVNPICLEQLVIPPAYQTYLQSEEREEQFLLDDSGVYEESGRQQSLSRVLNFLFFNFRDTDFWLGFLCWMGA